MIPDYQDWDERDQFPPVRSSIAEKILGVLCAVAAVAIVAMSIAEVIPK